MLMNSRNIKAVVFALMGSTLLVGCGSESSTSSKTLGSEADTAAVQVADYTIIPAVTNFYSQAQTLDNTAESFCSSITQENLTALQNQWKETAKAWYQVLPFKFGPMVGGLDANIIEPIYASIDYFRFNKGVDRTSKVETKIKDWVEGSDTITDTLILNQSAFYSGFLPLEVTIFQTTDDTPLTTLASVSAEFTSEPRKCQVLTGLTNKLIATAGEIKDGWQVDYAGTGKSYRDMLANDELEEAEVNDSGDSAISKVTVSVQDYFDYLKNRDVTESTGQISDSIWQSVEASLLSVDDVLIGTSDTTLSLEAIMKNNGFISSVSLVQANMDTLRTAIDEENTTDFKAAAGILDGNFKRDVPDALGVSLGLNFSDGD